MRRLSTLGKELRDAQTGLDSTQLRTLSEQRRRLITDLLEQARAHATDAGLRLTAAVLSEVEATLQDRACRPRRRADHSQRASGATPLCTAALGQPRPRSTVPHDQVSGRFAAC